MKYAVILAGGSGTRLWPWSRSRKPKQLLPMVGTSSLLGLAFERLEGIVPRERRLVCASDTLRAAICRDLGGLPESQFLAEPVGRDTAAAIGFCAATLQQRDPEAVLVVCTADHVIEPHEVFRQKLAQAFALAEVGTDTLVMFGVAPTGPSTAYGYLELDARADAAITVRGFREKPDAATAQAYFAAGPKKYLWNSGMFVWKAASFLDCLRVHEPELHAGVRTIAEAYDTPRRDEVIARIYPSLRKTSIDYAVMEPASRDPRMRMLAVPLDLRWLDVGSWCAYAELCVHEGTNAVSAECHTLIDCERVLVASDQPHHLVAAIGCEDLIVIHTADATLVCRADQAERVKELHNIVEERFGDTYL